MVLRGTPPASEHGGDLLGARAAFPHAPLPWIDLSTGISPHSYPQIALPATALTRLPEPARIARLSEVAARAYGVPDTACVVATPGTQMALPHVYRLRPPGRVVVLGPTYSGHADAARLSGHVVVETTDPDDLAGAGIAVVVNPNNPDGRICARTELLDLATALRARRGLLVVDEAFGEVAPSGASLAADVADGGIVVLRSFGKFYGLAGLRLGFAIGAVELVAPLQAALGPWAVSGPALEYGLVALADADWQAAARDRLARDGARLAALLADHGLPSTGTDLFRHLLDDDAPAIHAALGESGILVRRFSGRPRELRIGLPGGETEWARLDAALAAWRTKEGRTWRLKHA